MSKRRPEQLRLFTLPEDKSEDRRPSWIQLALPLSLPKVK